MQGKRAIKIRILAGVSLMALIVIPARAADYLFEAYICEVAEASLHERSWSIPTNLIAAVTTYVDHGTARAFMGTYADDVVAFPVLPLRLGEKTGVDEQRPIRYGMEFDEVGAVTRYDETGVGLRIEAELLDERPDRLEIEFQIEQTVLDNWRPHTATGGAEVQLPAFRTRSWNMAPTFTPDQWLWIGGPSRITDGERWHQIMLIRVRPAASAP